MRARCGISFIEKLSFNAFNEGTRLGHCIKMHKRLFGVDAKKISGDTGYAGTANRDLCKELGIQTSFAKRGRPSAEKKMEGDYVRQEQGYTYVKWRCSRNIKF